jgi:hypothetical protein
VAISMLPKRHDPVLRFFESCKGYRQHEDRALRWLVSLALEIAVCCGVLHLVLESLAEHRACHIKFVVPGGGCMRTGHYSAVEPRYILGCCACCQRLDDSLAAHAQPQTRCAGTAAKQHGSAWWWFCYTDAVSPNTGVANSQTRVDYCQSSRHSTNQPSIVRPSGYLSNLQFPTPRNWPP